MPGHKVTLMSERHLLSSEEHIERLKRRIRERELKVRELRLQLCKTGDLRKADEIRHQLGLLAGDTAADLHEIKFWQSVTQPKRL
jgi:hypothetical protein